MKQLLIIIFCFVFSDIAIANDKNQQRNAFTPERYRKEMEAFIAHEAALSQQEQQEVFPILNEMLEAQRKLKQQEWELMKCGDNAKSEAEFEQIMKQAVCLKFQNQKLEQSYFPRFKKILSWEKMYKVRRAVQRFSMKALQNYSPRPKGGKRPDRKED